MKIQFLGVGSAFTLPAAEEDGTYDLNKCDWQTNAMIIADSGKKMLIDCGSDIRISLLQAGNTPAQYGEIDAIYASHLHADHIGGFELMGFSTFFNPTIGKPKLYANHNIMKQMWEESLKGGLDSVQGQMMNLTSYYNCHAVADNDSFVWEGIKFTPVQTVHIMAGYTIKYSYGLLIKGKKSPTVFLTTDSQFCLHQIKTFYEQADLIIHDCETTPYKSGVHSHYDDLLTVEADIRSYMWLCHYQPNSTQDAVADGFAGFIKKGQVFDL